MSKILRPKDTVNQVNDLVNGPLGNFFVIFFLNQKMILYVICFAGGIKTDEFG